jgi:hypothetical protein
VIQAAALLACALALLFMTSEEMRHKKDLLEDFATHKVVDYTIVSSRLFYTLVMLKYGTATAAAFSGMYVLYPWLVEGSKRVLERRKSRFQ